MFVKIIKHISTIFVILACLLICLMGLVYYGYTLDDLDNELKSRFTIGEVKSAHALPLGDSYNGKTAENGSFYEVYVTFKNTGNYPADAYALDVEFFQSGPEYTDRRIYVPFYYQSGCRRCVPGNKEGVIKYVIELNDDVKSANMLYINEYTKEEQVINLEIRER